MERNMSRETDIPSHAKEKRMLAIERYEGNPIHDNVIFPCANPVIDGVMHIYYGTRIL